MDDSRGITGSVSEASPWIDLRDSSFQPCPYLPDHSAQLQFGITLPDSRTFDRLVQSGYRRIGLLFYRPACPAGCHECVPIRIRLAEQRPSRSQRRLLRRVASHYQVQLRPPYYSEAHLELYNRHASHVSPANEPCGREAYRRAFVDSGVQTYFIEYRIDGQLVCLSILDEGETTASSVYACWEPAFARYSPGTFSALWEMQWAADRGKEHYHLGYWVARCSRMSYKTRFRPYELMDWSSGRWNAAAETLR